MKHELFGFSMGQNRFHDETRQYHVIVDFGDGTAGAACNRKRLVSGGTHKTLPEDGHLCGRCDRILPQFQVNEHANGFSLTHLRSGKNHWLSDGVDVLFDADDNPISPGTKGFVEKWTREFNSNVGETLEAYFPELLED